MASSTRKCKVCGIEYEYCYTQRRVTIFRWQDVACCPEHGSIYFAEVQASRAAASAENKTVTENTETDAVASRSKKKEAAADITLTKSNDNETEKVVLKDSDNVDGTDATPVIPIDNDEEYEDANSEDDDNDDENDDESLTSEEDEAPSE